MSRPDLLLVGRPGEALNYVAATARATGATVKEISCDLSRLSDVRASADGYEMTFAVNYLAHAQLIGDLLDAFTSCRAPRSAASAGLSPSGSGTPLPAYRESRPGALGTPAGVDRPR